MKDEIIPEFPTYSITTDGSVWSQKTKRWLNPSAKRNGYLYVTIYDKDKKRYSRSIHSLVAEAYIGPRSNAQVVNHKSGNKLDNALHNLEYITVSQNNAHAYKIGLSSRKGSRAGGAKLTEKQVATIKRLLAKEQLSHAQIAEKYEVSRTTITMIANHKT